MMRQEIVEWEVVEIFWRNGQDIQLFPVSHLATTLDVLHPYPEINPYHLPHCVLLLRYVYFD